MAPLKWQQKLSLIESFLASPTSFEWQQALKILLHSFKESASVLSQKEILIKGHFSYKPQSSEVYKLSQNQGEGGTLCLYLNVFSLGGVYGPLPEPYVERVITQNQKKNFAFQSFLDIFHHRLVSVTFHLQQKLSPQLNPISLSQHSLGHIFSCLSGLSGLPFESTLLPFVSLFWKRGVSLEDLKILLGTFLSIPIEVHPFQGGWIALRSEEQSFIGKSGQYAILGQGCVLGKRLWNQTRGLLIIFGPLPWRILIQILVDPIFSQKLYEMLCYVVGPLAKIRLKVLIGRNDIQSLYLGRQTPFHLGKNTWLALDSKGKNQVYEIFKEIRR